MFQEPLGLTLSALPSKDASQVNNKNFDTFEKEKQNNNE